jgi:hypothetical protein
MIFVGIILALLFAFSFWYFSFRYWHLGNGMVLARNKDDGTVWVASRLVDSPSGRAGVKNQSRVLFRNNKKLIFQTDEEFLSWVRESKGTVATWTFEGGLVVELVPEMIRTEIPVYWVPGESFREERAKLDRNELVRKGMMICRTTEQHIPLYSVPSKIMRRLLNV